MAGDDSRILTERTTMAVIGAIAGFASWALIDYLPDIVTNAHALLFVTSAVAGFFVILLALCGPLSVSRAALGALLVAVPASVLLGWASLSFDSPEAFLGSGLYLTAWSILLMIWTPFVAVWLREPEYWNSYLDLFEASWSIVVRYAAAWLFVGVFMLVLILSNELLSLVSVTIIEDLMDVEAVPNVLVGAVLGLALHAVYEMRDYLSPDMVLRLLRLLLPVLLVVVVIFVVALPFSDTGDLFGGLSPAGTIMSVALGAISLVSIGLDKSDADAARSDILIWSARGLSILLPVLAGLALYGIWLRVSAYGWTPLRLGAMLAALIIATYSVLYALSALSGAHWMRRIRQGNIGVAGLVAAVAALWLTPILNAEAISVRSQVERYLSGETPAKELALWELSHEWGSAGRTQLDRLKALDDREHSELQILIAKAETAESWYDFEEGLGVNDRDNRIRALLDVILPAVGTQEITPEMLKDLPDYRIEQFADQCSDRASQSCVLVLDDFNASAPGLEGILFLPASRSEYFALSVWLDDGVLRVLDNISDPSGGDWLHLPNAQVTRILRGEFTIAPSQRKALWLDDLEILPEN